MEYQYDLHLSVGKHPDTERMQYLVKNLTFPAPISDRDKINLSRLEELEILQRINQATYEWSHPSRFHVPVDHVLQTPGETPIIKSFIMFPDKKIQSKKGFIRDLERCLDNFKYDSTPPPINLDITVNA